MEGIELVKIKAFEDERGFLKKVFKKSFFDINNKVEEVYVLYSYKGSVRGNHYHKVNTECFFIISGTAKVAIQNIKTGHYNEMEIDCKDNILIIVHPFIAHAFKNEKDEELIILAIATKEYDPMEKDTYKLDILK